MQMHFTAARAIRTFVIAGQLDGVPESAEWLIEHETPPGLPAGWRPYIADMRQYAEEAADAGHLVFAAAALAEMARTCGECHAANGVRIDFEANVESPPAGSNMNAKMRRHLWATERLWEGLIGPSDLAWNRGVTLLAGTHLEVADFNVMPEQAPTLRYLLKRKREIGRAGVEAKTGRERSALYGEFLGMCGDCHQLVGRGPQPPRTVVPAGE